MISRWRIPGIVLTAAAVLSCGQQSWEDVMQAGEASLQKGQYQEAERTFSAAVKKAEAFGAHDRRVAVSLSRLGQALSAQGKFVEAEPVYLQALTIYQEVHGENHLDVAAALNNLGVLHRKHGQYADAQRLLARALSIKERLLGAEHPDIALALTNLATMHLAQSEWGRRLPYSRARSPFARSNSGRTIPN